MVDEVIYSLLQHRKEIKESENKIICARDIVLDALETSPNKDDYLTSLENEVITVEMKNKKELSFSFSYTGSMLRLFVNDLHYHDILIPDNNNDEVF